MNELHLALIPTLSSSSLFPTHLSSYSSCLPPTSFITFCCQLLPINFVEKIVWKNDKDEENFAAQWEKRNCPWVARKVDSMQWNRGNNTGKSTAHAPSRRQREGERESEHNTGIFEECRIAFPVQCQGKGPQGITLCNYSICCITRAVNTL